MLLRRALPATHQSLAHLFPIYEMGSRKGSAGRRLNSESLGGAEHLRFEFVRPNRSGSHNGQRPVKDCQADDFRARGTWGLARRGDRHSLRALAENGFQRHARIEVFCSQPLAIKKRRLVLVPGVAEKRDECLASAMLLRETDSTGDVDPAGKSEEQTFFAQKLVDDR